MKITSTVSVEGAAQLGKSGLVEWHHRCQGNNIKLYVVWVFSLWLVAVPSQSLGTHWQVETPCPALLVSKGTESVIPEILHKVNESSVRGLLGYLLLNSTKTYWCILVPKTGWERRCSCMCSVLPFCVATSQLFISALATQPGYLTSWLRSSWSETGGCSWMQMFTALLQLGWTQPCTLKTPKARGYSVYTVFFHLAYWVFTPASISCFIFSCTNVCWHDSTYDTLYFHRSHQGAEN